jgi:L-alanine-DL-glutamate epimerase-like enolase superfamily enzyme
LHTVRVEVPLLSEKIATSVLFARVETDEGITGYGLTRGTQRFALREFINRELAPFLRDKNPLETERVWQQLYTTFNPRGQTGMWSSAVSAIDIALWDIKGKKYNEPVWRLLGGARNPVQSYVTFGLKQYSTEQLIEVAKQVVARGEKRLKMVVAVDPENPGVDAARVRAVRQAVGDEVELMIDANYLFSFNRALELCKLVEPYNIT